MRLLTWSLSIAVVTSVALSKDAKPDELARKVETIKKLAAAGQGILNECALCNFVSQFEKKAELFDDFRVLVEDKCEIVGKKYGLSCEYVASQMIDRIRGYTQSYASTCASTCDKKKILNKETLCSFASNLHTNMDVHAAALEQDLEATCKNNANPFKCSQQMQRIAPFFGGMMRRMVIRFIDVFDKNERCGVDISKVPNADILQGRDDESLECQFCDYINMWLKDILGATGNSKPGQAVVASLEKAVTDVCISLNLLGDESQDQCTGLGLLGASIIEQLLVGPLLDAIVCPTLFGCPAPSSSGPK